MTLRAFTCWPSTQARETSAKSFTLSTLSIECAESKVVPCRMLRVDCRKLKVQLCNFFSNDETAKVAAESKATWCCNYQHSASLSALYIRRLYYHLNWVRALRIKGAWRASAVDLSRRRRRRRMRARWRRWRSCFSLRRLFSNAQDCYRLPWCHPCQLRQPHIPGPQDYPLCMPFMWLVSYDHHLEYFSQC